MITIYGASDDLIEVSGCEGADEFNGERFLARIIGPGATEQIQVACWYGDNGCWFVGVGQVDEEVPLPPWPLTIRQGRGMTEAARQGKEAPESAYSAVLEIDAPAGARLDVIEPKPDGD